MTKCKDRMTDFVKGFASRPCNKALVFITRRNHTTLSIELLQKAVLLGTAQILRKVLDTV